MDDFLKWLESSSNYISSIIWGPATILFIIFTGLFFTIKLKFFQLLQIKTWLKHTLLALFKKKGKDTNSKNITPIQAMSSALAGAIGTGNIVGVATAITLGGPGAVFFMWIAAFLGMATIFVENILGVKYRIKDKNGCFIGGPMYYMKNGLNSKFLAGFFSIACIFATFGTGNLTQSNSISNALQSTFGVRPFLTGIILAIVSGIIIFGGIKRIAGITEKIVPFMALFYVVGGLIILIVNFKSIPKVFYQIFHDAFNFKSAFSAVGGITISQSIKYGIARGIFTNEAGLGSSPIVHASAETDEPITQGMWGIFQIFIDTFVVCSITALCILSTGTFYSESEGAALSIKTFESVFGKYGGVFICVSTVLFAFATIISWSYYGQRSIEFLSGKKWVNVYKAVYIVIIMFACPLDLRLVWSLSDIFNGLMCIPNLIAILFLSKEVISYVKDWKQKNLNHG